VYPRVDCGVDDMLRAEHVGSYGFERVVFARRYLLHGRRVHDNVGSFDRPCHSGTVADVADQVPELLITEAGAHLRLFELIARVHAYRCFGPASEDACDERVPE